MLPGQAFSFEKRTRHCRGARCDIFVRSRRRCIGALVLKELFTRFFSNSTFHAYELSNHMPRRKLQTRPRGWSRVVILGLVGIAAAACSDSARFNSYNADRPAPPRNVTSSVSGCPAGGHSGCGGTSADAPIKDRATADGQTGKGCEPSSGAE